MIITMERTDRIETVGGLRCRIWTGKTEHGVECFVFVPTIAVANSEDQRQFDQELEMMPPKPLTIDMRFVV